MESTGPYPRPIELKTMRLIANHVLMSYPDDSDVTLRTMAIGNALFIKH